MKIFSKEVKLSSFWLVILLMGILSILLFKQWQVEDDSKLNGIYGGLLTGLVIAIIQLFLSWYEYKEINRFKRMEVVDIRSHRDDRKYYEKIIVNAKARIDIMGVTASRFIADFADLDSQRNEARVLLKAMDQGVKVRILLPAPQHLTIAQVRPAEQATEGFNRLMAKYPDNFVVRYFNHPPAHSIFIFDNECILGPVFPIITSKDTPSIQLKNTSPYASKYLDYFEFEWNSAS